MTPEVMHMATGMHTATADTTTATPHNSAPHSPGNTFFSDDQPTRRTVPELAQRSQRDLAMQRECALFFGPLSFSEQEVRNLVRGVGFEPTKAFATGS